MNSLMAANVLETSSENSERSLKELEDAARATIDSLVGCPLSDRDWTRVSGRLLGFAAILRSWMQTTNRPRRGKV